MCFKETVSSALTPTPSGPASTERETAYSPKREGQWLPKQGLSTAIGLLARDQLHRVAWSCLLTLPLRVQGRSYSLLLPGSGCTIIQQTRILRESWRGLMLPPRARAVAGEAPRESGSLLHGSSQCGVSPSCREHVPRLLEAPRPSVKHGTILG